MSGAPRLVARVEVRRQRGPAGHGHLEARRLTYPHGRRLPSLYRGDVGRCGLVPFEGECLARHHRVARTQGGRYEPGKGQRLPSLCMGDVGRWRHTGPFHRGILEVAPCCLMSVLGSGSLCFLRGRAWLFRAPRLWVGRATTGYARAGRSRGTSEHARALLPCAGVSSGVERQSPRRTPVEEGEGFRL